MAPIIQIIQILPHHYIHVLDQNTMVTRLETGPLNYIHQVNERMLFSPKRMITVPPRYYCMVANPVKRDDKDQVLFDKSGWAKLRHGDQETRLTQDPFPLYPGEEIQQDVTLLPTVEAGEALRLKALQDFEDERGQKRAAGDEWLFKGPGTYIPRKEVEVLETIKGPDSGRILKVAGTVAGIAAGAVGAVALAPVALAAVGFTSAGIASGSIAAGMMSSAAIANGGGVAAGSLVAVLQSAGAVGLSATASAAVGSVGAAVGGAVGGAAAWLTGVFRKKKRRPTLKE
ncbi:major vault protein-like [Scomber scombrus]|uniref:major vault protein-like n=1 Tax=Scomber scombrus TaxID=13677 RepID=UPI002DDC6B75|nr:major vault protein-like [Scomber scombrus]XP_062294134.1 major vault protein-like [Scomber scombrus]